MENCESYYVYSYIDPRSNEQFFYGYSCGPKHDLRQLDDPNRDARQIIAIRNADMEPRLRVIATGLTKERAQLVTQTLLWKLGSAAAFYSFGKYVSPFRPLNTLDREVPGFDYQRGIYYYNVGEGPTRNWDDYLVFGFISAGQGIRWRDAMLGFNEGDVVVAYLKGFGFVGVGQLISNVLPIRDVKIGNLPLLEHELCCKGMATNVHSNELCEYAAAVRWIKAFPRESAKWKPRSGIYTTTHVRASLDGQPKTIAFIEEQFELNLCDLIT